MRLTKKKKHRKHWYLTEVYECPVCGGSHEQRSRVYGKKPKDLNKTYEYHEIYDYCIERDSIAFM